MDLIGIPYQLIICPKGVKSGDAEIKIRKGGERQTIPMDKAVDELIGLVMAARKLG